MLPLLLPVSVVAVMVAVAVSVFMMLRLVSMIAATLLVLQVLIFINYVVGGVCRCDEVFL